MARLLESAGFFAISVSVLTSADGFSGLDSPFLEVSEVELFAGSTAEAKSGNPIGMFRSTRRVIRTIEHFTARTLSTFLPRLSP